MASTDATIADVLAGQRGYGARWQLLAAGVPAGAIKRRVRGERLFAVRPGVYAAFRPQRTRWETVLAATLASGEGALASSWSAAEVVGLVRAVDGPVHVLSPGAFTRHPKGVRDHRIARLDPQDVWAFDAIPCTAIPLTLLDLAATCSPRVLERKVDRAVVEGLCDEATLTDVAARHPGRPGAGALRRLLAQHDVGTSDTRSAGEEELRRFLVHRGLPLPQFNVPRVLPSGRRIVHDALWADRGVVLEFDARSTHDTPLRFEEDRERDLEVQLLGLRTARVTRRRLRRDPGRLDRQLRALLELGG